jgi:uncharacterized protein (TIGR03435 family)
VGDVDQGAWNPFGASFFDFGSLLLRIWDSGFLEITSPERVGVVYLASHKAFLLPTSPRLESHCCAELQGGPHILMRIIDKALVFAMIAGVAALSVAQTAQRPSFEVSSVKPSPPGSRTRDNTRGNRFAISGAPLRLLLRYAYPAFLNSQIASAPTWTDSDLFDVEGKSDSDRISEAQMALFVQSLLRDRFQLKAHTEMRELPIYELRLAKSEPKIKASENQTVVPPQPGISFKPDMPPPGFLAVSRSVSGTIRIVGTAIPLSDFVISLSRQVNRPVIDKTNLTGLFDLRLEFVPDGVTSAPPVAGQTAPVGASDPAGPFLLEAVERELGLKLESAKGPVEVLVIDSVSKPTEN